MRKRRKRGPKAAKGERIEELALGILTRSFTILRDDHDLDDAGDDDEGRTIEFSFSSEDPYERYFGVEILGHKKSEVRLNRLNDGGAFLKDHFTTQQIGVVEKAWIDTGSGMGRVRARFGRTGLAEEERVEVRDGIRTKISVGYLVHKMRLESTDDEGLDSYRVTDWEPLETSTVAIPADATVGIGREEMLPGLAARAAEFKNHRTVVVIPAGVRRRKPVRIQVIRKEDGVVLMVEEREFDEALHEKVIAPATTPTPATVPAAREVDAAVAPTADQLAEAARVAALAERDRVKQIQELGTKFNASDQASKAISEGLTQEAFVQQLWLAGATPVAEGVAAAGTRVYPTLETPPGQLDLSAKDAGSYSILRAIRSHVEKDPTIAPFERQCSREIEDRLGTPPRGFYCPRDILDVPLNPTGDRTVADKLADLVRVVGTGTQGGGSLVATDLLAASFIDILRNQSVVMNMGATFIPGLVGDVDIPRQSGAGAAGWIAEGGSVAFADLTLDTLQLRPKTIGAKSKITRRLMLQSTPAVEGLVRADLAMGVALGIDLGAVQGTGTGNQPTGILNMAGVSVVLADAASPTNGGAMTWQAQVELVKQVKKANAFLGSLGFVTTADAWGHMMVTPRIGTTFPTFILGEPGETSLGRRLLVSEQVPSDLTKGSGTALSAEIYGNWADLLIGEWGTLDLFPDPFTDGDEGAVILRAFQDADVQARHELSFSVIVDMITV